MTSNRAFGGYKLSRTNTTPEVDKIKNKPINNNVERAKQTNKKIRDVEYDNIKTFKLNMNKLRI